MLIPAREHISLPLISIPERRGDERLRGPQRGPASRLDALRRQGTLRASSRTGTLGVCGARTAEEQATHSPGVDLWPQQGTVGAAALLDTSAFYWVFFWSHDRLTWCRTTGVICFSLLMRNSPFYDVTAGWGRFSFPSTLPWWGLI